MHQGRVERAMVASRAGPLVIGNDNYYHSNMQPPSASPQPPRDAPPELISANTLFRGAREVIIEFRGTRYRLRITSNGKLILTK